MARFIAVGLVLLVSPVQDLTRPACLPGLTRPPLPRSKERIDRIQELRWTHRTLPEHVKANLSPLELQYFRSYDKLLNKYMRSGGRGVGLDLTADPMPPDDPYVQVGGGRRGSGRGGTAALAVLQGAAHIDGLAGWRDPRHPASSSPPPAPLCLALPCPLTPPCAGARPARLQRRRVHQRQGQPAARQEPLAAQRRGAPAHHGRGAGAGGQRGQQLACPARLSPPAGRQAASHIETNPDAHL